MEKNFSPEEKTSEPSLENLRAIEEKNLLVVEEIFSEIKSINEHIIAILKEKNGRNENLQDQDDELNTLSLSSKELMTKLEKALKDWRESIKATQNFLDEKLAKLK